MWRLEEGLRFWKNMSQSCPPARKLTHTTLTPKLERKVQPSHKAE